MTITILEYCLHCVFKPFWSHTGLVEMLAALPTRCVSLNELLASPRLTFTFFICRMLYINIC